MPEIDLSNIREHHVARLNGLKVPMPEVNRDPAAAWSWLVEKGGIEIDGRDLDLVASLKERLDPQASSLEQAIYAASMTQFLNSFFAVLSPYVLPAEIRDFFMGGHPTRHQRKGIKR